MLSRLACEAKKWGFFWLSVKRGSSLLQGRKKDESQGNKCHARTMMHCAADKALEMSIMCRLGK
jgi:hypothetical protein